MTGHEFSQIGTPLAALLAGLVTSLHCAGMCGPMACLGSGGPAAGRRAWLMPALTYHAGRMLSYTVLGALAGAFSHRLDSLFSSSITQGLPWVFIALFLAMVLGLEKNFRFPAGINRFFLPVLAKILSRPGRGLFLVGLGTPLLPCGPLYLILGAMLLSGSAAQGAWLMLCFAFGTVGLLFLLQCGMGVGASFLKPSMLLWLRRGMALLALLLMVWRAAHDLRLFSGDTPACPLCH